MKNIVESTDPKQPLISHQRSWVRLCTSKMLTSGAVWIFTDGSSLGSYAAAIVSKNTHGETNVLWSGSGFEPMTSTRNVGAELNGAYLGLSNVPTTKEVPVVLVFDYIGIGAWLTDNWKIRDIEVEGKVARMKKLIRERGFSVRYIHHRGHQRDDSDFSRWNNEVDSLATAAAAAQANIVDGVGGLDE